MPPAPKVPGDKTPTSPDTTSLLSWTSRFAVVTLHSFAAGTLRLYYTPQPGAPVMTTTLDVSPLFERLDGLRRHRCDNGAHRSFPMEARNTEVAHLLEHLLVELLAQSGAARAQIQGATNLDEAPARYRIKVSGWTCATQAEEAVAEALRLLDAIW